MAASAGAACHSDTVEISYVLSAMQIPEQWPKGRCGSVSAMTTIPEIDRALELVVDAVEKLRGVRGL
ncbi:MAG: hypothetical protein R2875_05310 [Desulfobacterales bacterium]